MVETSTQDPSSESSSEDSEDSSISDRGSDKASEEFEATEAPPSKSGKKTSDDPIDYDTLLHLFNDCKVKHDKNIAATKIQNGLKQQGQRQ